MHDDSRLPMAALGSGTSILLSGATLLLKLLHWYADNITVLAGTASMLVSAATLYVLFRKKKEGQ